MHSVRSGSSVPEARRTQPASLGWDSAHRGLGGPVISRLRSFTAVDSSSALPDPVSLWLFKTISIQTLVWGLGREGEKAGAVFKWPSARRHPNNLCHENRQPRGRWLGNQWILTEENASRCVHLSFSRSSESSKYQGSNIK